MVCSWRDVLRRIDIAILTALFVFVWRRDPAVQLQLGAFEHTDAIVK